MCQQEIIYSHTLQTPDVDNDKNKEEVEDVVENEQKQFNSILLSEESRDMTTTRTPLGLMRWKRLIMGTKDTSGRFQQECTKAMNKHLSEEDRKHMINFQDDFVGFSNDLPTLFRTFEGFLTTCRKSRVTINPAKLCVTVRHVKFCGFILNEQGVQPSEKTSDSIKKMIVPKNRSETRSVMGMFNQFRQTHTVDCGRGEHSKTHRAVILFDECQDLNESCRYPPTKEFHKRHKQMNRMCEHSQKFGKYLMLNKMCSCWGRDTALHHMSSLLTSFLRHMLRHSHVTIMKIVHLDAVKIDCTTILCDESQDLNASHAPSGKRIPQETQRPCRYPPAKEFHKRHRHKQMNRMCEHSQKFGKCLM